jgi:hypothetical protein
MQTTGVKMVNYLLIQRPIPPSWVCVEGRGREGIGWKRRGGEGVGREGPLWKVRTGPPKS